MCKFGAGCYRQNPQHFAEYDHPSDHSLFIQDTAGPAPPPAPAATGPTQADPFATTRFPGATEADRARARLAAVPLLRDVVRVLEDHPHQLAHFSKLGYRGFQVRPPAARYVVQSEGLTAKKIELIAPLASAHAYAEWAVPLPVASRVGWTCGERDLVRTGHAPPQGYGKYHYYVPNGLMNEDGSCAYSFTSNGHFNDHLVVFHFTVEHASGLTYEETPEIEALYRDKLVGFGILRDNPEAAVDRGLLDKLGIQWSHVARGRQRPTSNHASKRQSVHRSATMFKVVVDVHSKTKANELFTARFASGNPTNTNAHLISKLLGLKKGDVHCYLSRCPLAAKEREAYCCAIGTDSDGIIVGAVCFRHVERPRRASASQYGFTVLRSSCS